MEPQQSRADGQIKPKGPIARFFSFIFRVLRNYFAFIGLLVSIIPILFAIALSKGSRKEAPLEVKPDSTLELQLSGAIAQREPGFESEIMRRIFGGPDEIYLPEIRAALKRAGADARIAGVSVRFGSLMASAAEHAELRRMLADFRAAGKRVDVVLDEADDWSYYTASAGSRLVLTPASSLTLTGPTFQLVYFGEALRKLGLEMTVVRAGKYKSAFEPFVADAPTDPTLEEYRSMQKSLLGHIVGAVAEGRAKDPVDVAAWYRRSIFTASEALKLGIVDEVGYAPADEPQDVKDRLSVAEYGAAPHDGTAASEAEEGQGGIALIEAVGEINMAPSSDLSNEDVITPDRMREQIRWARDDKEVKAVVMRVSSPGGSAVASDIIWNELHALAQEKPLVVSMGAYAASGGYYISAPAKRIVAEPTTITGSIGVIGMLPNATAFKEKYGISFYVVTGSDREALFNLGAKPTAADLALVDETIADVYQTFLSKVAEGRGLPLADVEALAQGRVYTGLEAKELKLVDEIGGLQAAFDAAKELAGFDKSKLYPVLRYQSEDMSLRACLRNPQAMMKCLGEVESRAGGGLASTPMTAERVARKLAMWVDPLGRSDPLALWPGYLGLKLSR